jgi:putative ABC transport system permease protein
MRFPFWRRQRQDKELEEEIQAHLEMAKRDRMERGQTAEEAQAAARREFGNVGLIKEVTREMWGWTWLERLGQDLRYGARMLLKSPGFTLISILTLALGIGANTAIFSVIDAVLLRPLAFNEPDRLARLYQVSDKNTFSRQPVSGPNFQDCKNQSRMFESLAAYGNRIANITGADEPERVLLTAVSADYFKVMKVEPVLGRAFLPEEDKPGGPRVVILSYGFWQQRFGADPNIVGKTLTLDGYNFTIIGVMPREAQLSSNRQFWRPLGADYYATNRGNQFLNVIGRLKPGVSWPQVQTEMDSLVERFAKEDPWLGSGWCLVVRPIAEEVVGPIRPSLLLLLGAVGFVLLIACANVASLLLARAASREKEFAVRAALGASRWRLMRQLGVESMLLAMVGGALALLLAPWTTKALVALSAGIPRMEEIGVDHRVLGFTLAVSLLTGLIFGLFPALQISKPDLNESLKEGGRGGGGVRRHRLRSLLVVTEVALSMVLLVGAGLMIKSFWRLLAVDPGFTPERVLSMELSLPRQRYPQAEQQAAFSAHLVRELAAAPDVESVGVIANRPFSNSNMGYAFIIEGRPPLPLGQITSADYNSATPDYFQTLSIPLLKGRVFTEQDTGQSPPVAVISETMARHFWPGEDPVGQRLIIDDGGPNPRQIVGVVGDVKHYGLEDGARQAMYLPFTQKPYRIMTLMVRASGGDSNVTAAVRRRIRELEKDAPINSVITMSQVVSNSVAPRRFSTLLLAIFAGFALLLAMVGVYGVMSYAVERRTHEIGIRMALGARASDVLRLVIRQGMTLAVVGVAIGTLFAFAMAKLITNFYSGMLFGVEPTDWSTYALIALLLLAVALMPCLIPARRATKVDPLVAIRCE